MAIHRFTAVSQPHGSRGSYGDFYGVRERRIFQSQSEIDDLNASSPIGQYQEVNTSPGDIKFKDINGRDSITTYRPPDGYINDDDRTYLGRAIPNLISDSISMPHTKASILGFQPADLQETWFSTPLQQGSKEAVAGIITQRICWIAGPRAIPIRMYPGCSCRSQQELQEFFKMAWEGRLSENHKCWARLYHSHQFNVENQDQ